jgi:hypothetical protein
MDELTPEQAAELNDLLSKINKSQADILRIRELLNEKYGKTTEYLKQQTELLQTIADQSKERGDQLDAEISRHETIIADLKERIDLSQKEGEINEVLVAQLRRRVKLRDRAIEKQQKLNEEVSNAASAGQNFAKVLGLGSTFQETMIGKAVGLSKILNNNTKAQKEFAESIKSANVPMALLAGTFEKVLEASIAQAVILDQQVAQFARATGAGLQFQDSILGVGMASRSLGIGFEEAGQAATGLFQSFVGFTSLAPAQRNEFIKTTAQLEKMGVSSTLTGESLTFFTKSLGMSSQAALDLTVDLAEAATGMGISMSQMIGDAQQAQIVFAQFGNVVGQQVFLELQKQAKATGIAIGELLSITEQFRTFDGAAMAVGRLNAAIGDNLLNSIDLMTMKDDEIIRTLQGVIQGSLGSADALDMFTKRMFANILTGGDVTKFLKLMNGELEEQAVQQQKLDKATQATVTITEKFKNLMASLVINAKPALDILGNLITSFTELIDENRGFAKAIGYVILGLGAIALLGASLAPALIGMGVAFGSISFSSMSAAFGIQAISTAALAGAKGLFILLAVFGGIALAIAAATSAMASYQQQSANAQRANAAFANSLASIDPAKEASFGNMVKHYEHAVKVSQDAGAETLTNATAFATALTAPQAPAANTINNRNTNTVNNSRPFNIVVKIGNETIKTITEKQVTKILKEKLGT